MAVDCGGTSTRAVLLDGDRVRGRLDGPATLSGYLEPARIAETMRHMLGAIEDDYVRAGLNGEPVTIAITAAGFVDSLRREFERGARALADEAFGGCVDAVVVVNDAVGLLLGHQADGVVIAGTGSSVLLRDRDGSVTQSGGHDWVAADDGSAFWVGLEGVRRVARDVDNGVESALRQAFRQTYGVDDARIVAMFRELAVAGPGMKADIARFAAGVCATAAAGDEAATGIVHRQGDALADLVTAGLDRTSVRSVVDRPIRVVECGGMFGDPFYRNRFEERVQALAARSGCRIDWPAVADGLDAATALASAVVREDAATRWAGLGECRPLVVWA
ncbi:N-acetyl-D-glucosamine kinase [Gordonia neofelifaecis NRRL B-59395]|uniref:N-acetyl-D-glucosamine kinase n=1 Tax=Gordonia neofelifaecis NRRL B-59395 TaxID=644548 RepID=F1YL50_9ACTN|nr:N-acetyl-D-glucosamine kinase [Gordonia neofelifaecis NRRL B-59395]